jgi:hypothetical protein
MLKARRYKKGPPTFAEGLSHHERFAHDSLQKLLAITPVNKKSALLNRLPFREN